MSSPAPARFFAVPARYNGRVICRVSARGSVWAWRASAVGQRPSPACLFLPASSPARAKAFAVCAGSLGWQAVVRPALAARAGPRVRSPPRPRPGRSRCGCLLACRPPPPAPNSAPVGRGWGRSRGCSCRHGLRCSVPALGRRAPGRSGRLGPARVGLGAVVRVCRRRGCSRGVLGGCRRRCSPAPALGGRWVVGLRVRRAGVGARGCALGRCRRRCCALVGGWPLVGPPPVSPGPALARVRPVRRGRWPGSGLVVFVGQLPSRAFAAGAWPSCGSGSWGSAGAAALLGLPVVLVPVGGLAGVSLSSLPAMPGGGSWSPVSSGVLAGGFRWSR